MKDKQLKVDIIIPCYNAHNTIDRCIGSILIQTAVNTCRVTLVNDAGKEYSEIIDRYKDILNIREIGYTENGGPGKSRNYGIDNTNCKYITFIDSDDVYASPFAIATLMQLMDEDDTIQLAIPNFLEELPNKTVEMHSKDLTFMHGKMYRRSFIDKYHIRFGGDLRCNEDMGFNMTCMLLLDRVTERAVFSLFVAYYWMYNQNSIARHDRILYNYCTTYKGMVEAFIYLFQNLKKHGRDKSKQVFREKIASMLRCIQMYCDNTKKAPQYESKNFKQLVKYYNKVYKSIYNKVSPELLSELYDTVPFTGNKEDNLVKIKQLFKAINNCR